MRPDMSEDKLRAILDRQTPDVEKRAKADFVIETAQGVESAHEQVRTIISQLTETGIS